MLPLIEVGAVDAQQPLDQAWRAMPHYLAAMFVSANAVEHFFSRQPGGIPVFNALSSLSARAWATGPGTVKALLRQGAEVAWMDAPLPAAGRFDSVPGKDSIRPMLRHCCVIVVSLGQIETTQKRIEVARIARELAQLTLDAEVKKLRAGTSSTFVVLELQESLAEIETREFRAHSDARKAIAEYDRQLGTTLKTHHVVLE